MGSNVSTTETGHRMKGGPARYRPPQPVCQPSPYQPNMRLISETLIVPVVAFARAVLTS